MPKSKKKGKRVPRKGRIFYPDLDHRSDHLHPYPPETVEETCTKIGAAIDSNDGVVPPKLFDDIAEELQCDVSLPYHWWIDRLARERRAAYRSNFGHERAELAEEGVRYARLALDAMAYKVGIAPDEEYERRGEEKPDPPLSHLRDALNVIQRVIDGDRNPKEAIDAMIVRLGVEITEKPPAKAPPLEPIKESD